MNTTSTELQQKNSTIAVLGVAAALLVVGVLANVSQSIGIGDRVAFWVLFAVGLTMCAMGPLGHGASYGWWNIRHIVGYILGAIILLLGAAVLFNVAVPGIASDRTAMMALAGLMVVKVGVAALYPR